MVEQQAESFSSTISHEIKTPLGSVLFFVKWIEQAVLYEDQELDKAKVARYFKIIFSSIMLVQTFVDDLLDLGQLKHDAFRFVESVFDPNEILQMIIEIFEPQASAKGISIEWNIEKGLKVPLDGTDESLLLDNIAKERP